LEIATALKRNIRVIPVLVDDASMPRPSDLPDDLKALVRRNAVEVSYTRFSADSERLIAALERVFEQAATVQREREPKERPEHVAQSQRMKPPPPSPSGTGGKNPSKLATTFLAIVAVLVVAGLVYLATRASQSPPPKPAALASSTPPSSMPGPTSSARNRLPKRNATSMRKTSQKRCRSYKKLLTLATRMP
jgi:hypothetical protein